MDGNDGVKREAVGEKRVECYYTNWSRYREQVDAKYKPEDINPYICTHLLYAFASLNSETYTEIVSTNPWADIDNEGYKKFTEQKLLNENLKTMLSLGGAKCQGSCPNDKQSYSLLVKELQQELIKEANRTGNTRLLLSMVIPAFSAYIQKGYEIPVLNENLDFFNVLAYDYHLSTGAFVYHHSPLCPTEEDLQDPLNSVLNVDTTIKYVIKSGASPHKINLGITTYGKLYQLEYPRRTAPGSPAEGQGMGNTTGEPGYKPYYEICQDIKVNGWKVVNATAEMGPYAYYDNLWVGYDDPVSVTRKGEYASMMGLGGLMFWTIDDDDFRGKCQVEKYPRILVGTRAIVGSRKTLPTPKTPSKTMISTFKLKNYSDYRELPDVSSSHFWKFSDDSSSSFWEFTDGSDSGFREWTDRTEPRFRNASTAVVSFRAFPKGVFWTFKTSGGQSEDTAKANPTQPTDVPATAGQLVQEMSVLTLFIVIPILVSAHEIQDKENTDGEKRVVCYYTDWSRYREGEKQFLSKHIDPYLCTHILYAFAKFDIMTGNTIVPVDPWADIHFAGFKNITDLKLVNKKLKTILSIGGWNEASENYSKLSADSFQRDTFSKNAVKYLRDHNFDGLDLAWQYPADIVRGGSLEDKENYALLVKDLRREIEEEAKTTKNERLLLTMVLPKFIDNVNKGYVVPIINEQVDFFNVVGYDYHYSSEPFIYNHAPLFPLEEDINDPINSALTVNTTIQGLIEKGFSPSKLNMGIPTYGRLYKLEDPTMTTPGSPAGGRGSGNSTVGEPGYKQYYEICQDIKAGGWTVVNATNAVGPYAYNSELWIGYDDPVTVIRKGEYAKKMGLGGLMFWTIDDDDFLGKCDGQKFPLITAGKNTIIGVSRIQEMNKPTYASSSTDMDQTLSQVTPVRLNITTSSADATTNLSTSKKGLLSKFQNSTLTTGLYSTLPPGFNSALPPTFNNAIPPAYNYAIPLPFSYLISPGSVYNPAQGSYPGLTYILPSGVSYVVSPGTNPSDISGNAISLPPSKDPSLTRRFTHVFPPSPTTDLPSSTATSFLQSIVTDSPPSISTNIPGKTSDFPSISIRKPPHDAPQSQSVLAPVLEKTLTSGFSPKNLFLQDFKVWVIKHLHLHNN